jgi:hypothetical protein
MQKCGVYHNDLMIGEDVFGKKKKKREIFKV